VNVLKGRNYFLYILLVINIFLGLVIYNFQKDSFPEPESFQKQPSITLGFKGVYKFPLILTNILPTNDLKRYLRIMPVLILDKEEVLNEIRIKETLIKDKIISYLNTQSEGQVLSDNGMNLVKENIKEIINKTLDQNKVSMIYFQEFRVN